MAKTTIRLETVREVYSVGDIVAEKGGSLGCLYEVRKVGDRTIWLQPLVSACYFDERRKKFVGVPFRMLKGCNPWRYMVLAVDARTKARKEMDARAAEKIAA